MEEMEEEDAPDTGLFVFRAPSDAASASASQGNVARGQFGLQICTAVAKAARGATTGDKPGQVYVWNGEVYYVEGVRKMWLRLAVRRGRSSREILNASRGVEANRLQRRVQRTHSINSLALFGPSMQIQVESRLRGGYVN